MRTKSLKFIPSKEVQYLSEDERDKYYLTLRAMGQNIERYDSIVLVPETLKLAQVNMIQELIIVLLNNSRSSKMKVG